MRIGNQRITSITSAGLALCLAIALIQTPFAFSQQPTAKQAPDEKPSPKGFFNRPPDPRVQQRTYLFEDTNEELPYALFVSSKVSTDKMNPLIIALHGLGGDHNSLMRGNILDLAEEGGYILVGAMGYRPGGWYGSPVVQFPKTKGSKELAPIEPPNLSELSEKDVINVLEMIRREFNVDDRRTYLMGHSMGGAGTLYLGSKYASNWAAIAGIAPAAFMMLKNRADILAPLKDAVPVIIIQGEKDTAVPIKYTHQWIETMKELNLKYKYIEMKDGDHGSVISGGMPDIFRFFAEHRKGNTDSVRTAAAMATAIGAGLCADLTNLSLENTRITSSEVVPQGIFQPPAGSFGPPTGGNPEPIPEHCKVTMVLTPSNDSLINVELWMPTQKWNGKFIGAGNGVWGGAIHGYGDMQENLRLGYATAASDSGHTGSPMSTEFALGHPEKVIDFAYRAIHKMAERSKQVIQAFYRRPPDYSYFKSCSTGGRQGVMSAQRYPGDFDRIIAGNMANRIVYMHTARVAESLRQSRHPESALSEEKAKLINAAIQEKCEIPDEGFLNNPHQCEFDFSALRCNGEERADCLTEAQLTTVGIFYGGLKTSDGTLVFSGLPFGNPIPAQSSSRFGGNGADISIVDFQNPDYDWNDFDLDRDMPRIESAAGFIDATDPDLRAFKAHGG
jgi:predicted esterase